MQSLGGIQTTNSRDRRHQTHQSRSKSSKKSIDGQIEVPDPGDIIVRIIRPGWEPDIGPNTEGLLDYVQNQYWQSNFDTNSFEIESINWDLKYVKDHLGALNWSRLLTGRHSSMHMDKDSIGPTNASQINLDKIFEIDLFKWFVDTH